jgi:hypothetical protein
MENDPLADFIKDHPMWADVIKDHPLGDLRNYPRGEVLAIQDSMAESASHFLAVELDALRGVVRLTVEFFHYLRRVDLELADEESLRYMAQSVFYGVESFISLCQAYRITQGQTRSTLPQRISSRAALKEAFIDMYLEFAAETNFEKRCRLLLDLFKLEIVFAGLTYD